MTVSVALCTRNGAAHVRDQFLSILAQTVSPDEIVVSDDASTDGTVSIIRLAFASYQRDMTGSAPVLRIIENLQPLGITRNFEQAMRAATGDLIALCDQDDVWHVDRLKSAIAQFDVMPALQMVHSDARLVDAAGTPLGSSLSSTLGFSRTEWDALRSGDEYRVLLRRNLVTGATAVVRRALLRSALPFPDPWVHDEWLGIIAAAFEGLGFSEEKLIDYRQHAANQIGVRRLGPLGKARRLIEPRNDRNNYLLERTWVLVDRLEQLGDIVPRGAVELARGKLAHQRFRADLPAPRPRRWIPIMREAATGRYSLFGRGGADVLRDLIQPAYGRGST